CPVSNKANLTPFCCSLSVYLHNILKNHTAHACEGDTLVIECPSRTSVAVLSAFYGRRVPNQPTLQYHTFFLQKVASECQDRRFCHIPVFSPVFGQDPCPLTSKYLLVSYKCRPGMLVCENERLRLMCKNETVLAIYSATFGHLLHGSPYCPQEPGSHTDMECLSSSALRKVSRRCHSRPTCSLVADIETFGDPCFTGTRKHLRVSYTCGKPLSPAGGWYTGPTYRPQNVLLTNSLEIIEKVLDLPERVALYFVSGICAGLVFLLCLFGIRSTLVRDVKDLVSDLKDEYKACHRRRNELMEDLFDEDFSDTSSFPHEECSRRKLLNNRHEQVNIPESGIVQDPRTISNFNFLV
uniref:Si:ch73-335m24.2 n=1 Tax=Cyclopterus lumpus TaxID=8103 RepID=A0A8C2WXP1_CYCLU